MGGRILAFREERGYRPVLVVKTVTFYDQRDNYRPCTILTGDQVLLPADGSSLGSAMPFNYQFQQFFEPQIGQRVAWNQMRSKTIYSLDSFYRHWWKLPLISIKQADLVLMAAGLDPTHGAWVQFEGKIPLFDQPEWWKEPEDEFYEEGDELLQF
jgi:hypothetical protein